MEYGMERWYMVAPQRFSVRKYDGEPSEEDLDALKEIAKSFSRNGVRIELGVDEKIFTPIFYGMARLRERRTMPRLSPEMIRIQEW